MKNLFTKLLGFRQPDPLPVVSPGLYHYLLEGDGNHTRYHLRVEPDGRGILIANATAAARFAPTGVIMAKGFLDGDEDGVITQRLLGQFRDASKNVVQDDLDTVKEVIARLATPDERYPVINLEDHQFSPHEAQLLAPIRADLPVAEPGKMNPILERLWDVAIPHVTFLAPESPHPGHVVQGVERAEDLGLIAGVRARGSDLITGTLVRDLALAGVDHLTVPFVCINPEIHDALFGVGDWNAARETITAAFRQEVCAVAEVALVENSLDMLEETLGALMALGVMTVSCFAIAVPDEIPAEKRAGAIGAKGLPQVAAQVEESAREAGLHFMWQPPVRKHEETSLVEQVRLGPRCSGDVSIRVEPDGSVIPPRGPYRSAGNLLTDSWETIWQNEDFCLYREKVDAPKPCEVCPGLSVCVAGCPAEPRSWAEQICETNSKRQPEEQPGERIRT